MSDLSKNMLIILTILSSLTVVHEDLFDKSLEILPGEEPWALQGL